MTTPPPPSPLPPPGWYPDPAGTGRNAYWNGRDWGEPPKPLEKSAKSHKLRNGLLIGLGIFVALAIIGNLLPNEKKEDRSTGRSETTITTNAPTQAGPPAAPETTAAAPSSAPPGKTMAGPDSSCTSTTAGTPIDLQTTRVQVGKVPGHEGTSAQITMTYTGEVPATGTVLWSLLATNPDGDLVQLGYKTLDGQKIAYFYFPFSEGMQHNMDGFADTDTPGEIGMIMPQAALDELGPMWWWSSVVNVGGEDIDTC